MAEQSTERGTWLIWMLFGIMGAISLACIGTGGSAWGYAIMTWIEHDYLFSGWGMLDWFVGLLGATLVGVGLLIAGFFFRFIQWRRAQAGSLAVSILSLAFILGTYAIFSQTQDGINTVDIIILQAGCLLGLFIVVLPPFLHWYMVRPQTGISASAKAP
jgi:hypothetical protein